METTREAYMRRNQVLYTERSTWLTHWQEINEYLLPRHFRYLFWDRNKGIKRNDKIVNNTATRALRTLSSGMMAGITSPARDWFRLTAPDPDLTEYGPVSAWLSDVHDRMSEVFTKSNIYNALPTTYADLGAFGTHAMYIEEDPKQVIRAAVFPLGQFSLALSSRGTVDTVFRQFSMTVRQTVDEFGIERVSGRVKSLYDEGRYDSWIEILHVIEPNKDHKPGLLGPRGMPYRSIWFEINGDLGANAAGEIEDTALRVSGYREFPVMTPRWYVTGEDVYGSCPGMDALGDVKALQIIERRKAQAFDKIVNPPMNVPAELRNQRASMLPGDANYIPHNAAAITPAITINPSAVQVAEASAREHEERINSTFFADLFLMLADSDRRQITAREVDERHEEKMLQLGPVLERVHGELLGPLIDRTFSVMVRRALIPPPPKELQGKELRVEYLSIMAQAQKLLGISNDERLAGFVGNLVAVKPEAIDLINTDELVRRYAQKLSIPPQVMRSDDEVAQLRAQRQQQQQAAQQGQAMMTAAQGAQTLSQADMQGDNALTRLANSLSPAAAAGAVPPAASTAPGGNQ